MSDDNVVDLRPRRRRRDPAAYIRGPAPPIVTREGFERGIARARDALEHARTTEPPTPIDQAVAE